MAERAILDTVKQYLASLTDRGLNPAFGVLFGSFARGQETDLSDIDLIVVDPKFDETKAYKIVSQLWRAAGLIDSRIEPIPCGLKQWAEDDGSPIIGIARREGIKITLEAEIVP